jgi:hypothetical protein
MKNKVFLLWVMMLLPGVIPTACDIFCRDSCGCGPITSPRNFIITDFSTEDIVLNINNFNPETFYDRGKFFKAIQVAQVAYITESTSKSPGISFFSAAYACDPIQGISEQRLISLEIINLKETALSEKELLMVGQDISDRFTLTDFPQFAGKTHHGIYPRKREFHHWRWPIVTVGRGYSRWNFGTGIYDQTQAR